MVTFEVESEEQRYGSRTLVGNVHEYGEILFVVLCKIDIDFFSGSQSSKGMAVFRQYFEMHVLRMLGSLTEHLCFKKSQ